jgi:hypothetical protein
MADLEQLKHREAAALQALDTAQKFLEKAKQMVEFARANWLEANKAYTNEKVRQEILDEQRNR